MTVGPALLADFHKSLARRNWKLQFIDAATDIRDFFLRQEIDLSGLREGSLIATRFELITSFESCFVGNVAGRSRSRLLTTISRQTDASNNPIHPGEMLLKEYLEPITLSQRAFAKKLGWTAAKLNELIRGKRGITADTALDLAHALKTSPELWMDL